VVSHSHHRHYYLAFFDILYLDGEPLLKKPYDTRRRCLEGVVQTIPGFVSSIIVYHSKVQVQTMSPIVLDQSQIAERYPIDLSQGNEFAKKQLETIFAASNARIEGESWT
jgi:hypothetical protein